MKILIIGNGAREYSIALRLAQDGNEIFMAPGNGASENIATNIAFNDFNELAKIAKDKQIDLSIVGPENALSEGVVDIFKANGLKIFGPSKAAARLESSKAFMKEFLAKYGIKTAKFLQSDNYDEICDFIDKMGSKIVVKADGLCAGKGVIIANNHDEAKLAAKDMLSGDSFGEAGKRVVVEEFLDGFELSFFAICDGKNFVSLPVAQDHKKLLDNDLGPNTGGMGAYAPSPLANANLIAKVEQEIVKKTLDGMKNEGSEFCGVLFVGLMVVENEPFVLEFNVRFGDPECEVLMPLIKGDLAKILSDASDGKLTKFDISDEFAVGIVMASENYPYKSSKKAEIFVKQIPQNTHISYAGVEKIDDKIYANGGRILVAVGVGDSIKQAQNRAYELVKNIEFSGARYRTDIAYQALK